MVVKILTLQNKYMQRKKKNKEPQTINTMQDLDSSTRKQLSMCFNTSSLNIILLLVHLEVVIVHHLEATKLFLYPDLLPNSKDP